MRSLEATPQQLDPLGTLTTLRIIMVFAIVSVGYAIVSTVLHGSQVTRPALAVLALVVLVGAWVLVIAASRPSRAPVSRATFLCAVGLGLAADAVSVAATWGGNRLIQDDWGQYGVTLLIAAVAVTRPSTEIVATGAVAAVVAGGLATIQSGFLQIVVIPGIYAIVALTPVIAFACASAGYSHTMVGRIRRWQHSARTAILSMEPEVREVTARVVNQEQATLLNAGAVPLFTRILHRDEITDTDIGRARESAAELRTAAVSAIERSWLDEVVFVALSAPAALAQRHESGPVAVGVPIVPASSTADAAALSAAVVLSRMPPGAPPGVDDPGHVAESVGSELRAVLSAFVRAVARHPGFDASSLQLALRKAGPGWKLRLDAEVAAPERQLRAAFVPYLAVIRVLTLDSALRCSGGKVTLKFAYDRS